MQIGLEALRERVRADAPLAALPHLTDQPLSLVGGVVRDALRGKTDAGDWDIVMLRDAVSLARRFADTIGGSFIHLHEAQPTARVVLGTTQYDLTEYRAGSLEDDLRARDLTINAVAIDLRKLLAGEDAPLIDPCGGLADLAAQQLQPCGPDVFAADPVRAVRLYRFVATLGFLSTEEAEAQAMQVARGGLIERNAPERVVDEFGQLFIGPYAADGIAGLARSGILEAIIPDVAATRGLVQGPNHHLDVFGHDLAAAQVIAGDFLPSLDAWAAPYAGELRAWLDEPVAGGRTRRWLVPFAALLHDVGKTVTRSTKPNGQPGFPRHEQAGAQMIRHVADTLRLSKTERRFLTAFVRYHGYPNDLQKHGPEHPLRLMAVLGTDAPGTILVSMGDRATARGPARPPEKVAQDVAFLQHLVRGYFGTYAPLLATPSLARGDDLMNALGISAGRRVGYLLLLLRRRQLTGEIATKEDAISIAKRLSSRLS